MRVTSFLGPDRPEQNPLTDADEVRECRRILQPYRVLKGRRMVGDTLEDVILVMRTQSSATDPDWLSAEEFYAAADRELWGDAPFEED